MKKTQQKTKIGLTHLTIDCAMQVEDLMVRVEIEYVKWLLTISLTVYSQTF